MVRNSIRRRAVILGGLAAATMVAQPGFAQNVSGQYRAEGRNADGSTYSGIVQIADTGSSVAVNWQVGNQAYQGTGYRSGDVIWIDWGDTYPIVYVRMPSGELHGTWANGRALERLIP